MGKQLLTLNLVLQDPEIQPPDDFIPMLVVIADGLRILKGSCFSGTFITEHGNYRPEEVMYYAVIPKQLPPELQIF